MRLKVSILLFIIVLTLGCINIPNQQSTQPTPTVTPTSTLPSFQSGIWDKAVINPPAGKEGLQPPFMFEIDIKSSYGFERKYLEHETFGKPVFVLSRGESASVLLLVSSQSNRTIQISLGNITGLPSGVTVRLKPESYVLQPNKQTKLEFNITVSPTAPTSTPEPEEPLPEEFIGLRLKGDGWSIGKAFHLKII